MLEISKPIIVEGKYDKIKLSRVVKAHIVTTDGFGIFSKTEKTALIRRLAEANGVIVITDSDGAGLIIRNYIRNILPQSKVTHIYTPQIKGKEKRKAELSKEGFLGVEGMDVAWLEEALAPFADGAPQKKTGGITKADLYRDGLSGREGSEEMRKKFSLFLSFPPDMTANALLAALNLLYTPEEYAARLAECFPEDLA